MLNFAINFHIEFSIAPEQSQNRMQKGTERKIYSSNAKVEFL